MVLLVYNTIIFKNIQTFRGNNTDDYCNETEMIIMMYHDMS